MGDIPKLGKTIIRVISFSSIVVLLGPIMLNFVNPLEDIISNFYLRIRNEMIYLIINLRRFLIEI